MLKFKTFHVDFFTRSSNNPQSIRTVFGDERMDVWNGLSLGKFRLGKGATEGNRIKALNGDC